MRNFLLFILFLATANIISAQTWDGGGTTDDWDDAMNWDNDMVPAAGDVVNIGADVTITGTVTNNPSRVIILSNFTVTFATNMTIGDGSTAQHALKVQGNATLNLGSGAGETFTINTATNKDGIQHNATGTPANLIVASGSTLTISQARDGVSITGAGTNVITNNGTIDITGADRDGMLLASGSFINNGTLNINSANQDAIDNEVTFTNTGILNIVDANSNGINNRATGTVDNSGTITITNPGVTTTDGIKSEGIIMNSITGIITSTKMDDDCVELTGGTFTNDGTLNVTVEDGGSTSNNGLAVGTSSAAATFTNSSNNSVNADGGISADGRAIYIYEMGTLTNTGTMTLTGGNTNSRLYSRGAFTNDNGGTIDMTDGRMNINQNTFTNDGLVESTRTSPSVFTTATVINNGFFKYDPSVNNFSSGSGTITDDGINLNDATETTIFANDLCTVDLAQTEYTYYNDGNVVATTDATGSLTIPMDGVISDPAILTLNEYPNKVVLTVTDICAQSILPIELSEFSAEMKDRKNVLLKWTTVSEINSDYIEIERSSDNYKWSVIGKENAQGNSNSRYDYEFLDNKMIFGAMYYRLKLVDLDGGYDYSEIQKVVSTRTLNDMRIYPSVLSVGDELNVEFTDVIDDVTIVATHLDGTFIELEKNKKGELFTIDTSKLYKGLYIISIVGDWGSHNYKIIMTD